MTEETLTCLLMVHNFINLQKKILKLFQIICASEMFQKIFKQATWKKKKKKKRKKTTGFNGSICNFSVDYYAIGVNHIKDIHLIKKMT